MLRHSPPPHGLLLRDPCPRTHRACPRTHRASVAQMSEAPKPLRALWQNAITTDDSASSGMPLYADEALSYGLALLGLSCQLYWDVALTFPLDVALFPLAAVEYFLRYQITFGGAGMAPAGV